MLIVPMPWWLYFTVAPVLLTLRFAVAALNLNPPIRFGWCDSGRVSAA